MDQENHSFCVLGSNLSKNIQFSTFNEKKKKKKNTYYDPLPWTCLLKLSVDGWWGKGGGKSIPITNFNFGKNLNFVYNCRSCTLVHELPERHYGDNWKGSSFSWFHLNMLILLLLDWNTFCCKSPVTTNIVPLLYGELLLVSENLLEPNIDTIKFTFTNDTQNDLTLKRIRVSTLHKHHYVGH